MKLFCFMAFFSFSLFNEIIKNGYNPLNLQRIHKKVLQYALEGDK